MEELQQESKLMQESQDWTEIWNWDLWDGINKWN